MLNNNIVSDEQTFDQMVEASSSDLIKLVSNFIVYYALKGTIDSFAYTKSVDESKLSNIIFNEMINN